MGLNTSINFCLLLINEGLSHYKDFCPLFDRRNDKNELCNKKSRNKRFKNC